jgi:hypothetical protein
MLVSSSQNTNIKLVDVARWLTETGVHIPHDTNGGRPQPWGKATDWLASRSHLPGINETAP